MESNADRAVAIVGVGAILPDAPDAPAFWQNICNKRYSIIDVPPERWSIADYYDPDPAAPDKTYTKIGSWVRGFRFDWQRFRIPPKTAAAMDEGQQWAVAIAAEALADYGYPERPLDTERAGVIFGTAMGGELHNLTTQRIVFPEYARALQDAAAFSSLPEPVRQAILQEWRERTGEVFPPVTEDTLPGELANIVAGRVANVLNLRGPNFVADAACASSFAAVSAAVEMLVDHRVDAFIAGGVDRNMGAAAFVKFCKVGALSATGSRPFAEGADGFVMGEGSAAFLLKRLADAERDGDRIYAVIRGIGASSDGRGKGITAPNPAGQRLAISRAWENAGLDPAGATLVEAHGTSTRVGDLAEVESLVSVFGGAERGSIALGSVKSNIGHLKAGAGAAGLLKAVYALHYKLLPPTLNAERPNPHIDFAATPFRLNSELVEWPRPNGGPRRAGVSAYGFGGTNFHAVLEEYRPGMIRTNAKTFAATAGFGQQAGAAAGAAGAAPSLSSALLSSKTPLRHIMAAGAADVSALHDKLDSLIRKAESGWLPPRELPSPAELQAPERLVLDFNSREELIERLGQARRAFSQDSARAWRTLQGRGVFRGSGAAQGKVAFLFTGQGSQYVNMGRDLVQADAIAGAVFAEADRTMAPILGQALTGHFFVDSDDADALRAGERSLMQTTVTQPAVLAMDTAIYELLCAYGFRPDMAMGHSLGEYGALIAAGVFSFPAALEISALRGHEMARASNGDQGWMAAVFAPLEAVEEILAQIDGYVVAANINSYSQCVIGGATDAVAEAIELFNGRGYRAVRIPVSHAFHTRMVAHASEPLRQALDRYEISPPALPLVSNVTGEFYPADPGAIKDLLERQIASPVQWVKGLETLYDAGVRTFVEVGPKKALKGLVDDVLGDRNDVLSLFTNHPKTGGVQSLNHALCGLYAAGYGIAPVEPQPISVSQRDSHPASAATSPANRQEVSPITPAQNPAPAESLNQALLQALQHIAQAPPASAAAYDRNAVPAGSVVITGAGLGLPGPDKAVMDPDNALRILRGEQFIDLIPERFRQRIAGKRITRLVKDEDGGGRFETIEDPAEVIKLAGRAGSFDLAAEYGVPEKLVEALDTTTQLAMAAGLDALREAGIPLVQTYKLTSKGTYLPDKWVLPEPLRDETGVIFASLFPGDDRMAEELQRYFAWESRRQQLEMLEDLRQYASDPAVQAEINRRAAGLREAIAAEPYEFDRRFLFRIMAMGHSQFAEFIGARGPNTQVNAACASTTQAVALAEDWIRSGRCRRVIVIGGDNVTSDNLIEWIGTGFLAVGATATDDRVDAVALPFDRRRHGTVLGMGACALVVESEDAVRERGMRGIAELLSSETANSAYHATRLEAEHISQVMNRLLTSAERRFGVNRYSMAAQTVFVSHETYTPARGGSASAEVAALRHTFGHAANDVIVANTKGFTGHPMGVGIEDVIAVKILEYGIVPPVPNFKEADPELGALNFSRGGRYPAQYALHLAAGFGSQIAMTLLRRIPGGLDRTDDRGRYRRWLADVSGYDMAETEVVKRVLHIKAQGAASRPPQSSAWQPGTGPVYRAAAPGDLAAPAYKPMPPLEPAPEPVRIAPQPVETPPPAPVEAETPRQEETAPVAQPVEQPAPAAEDAVASRVLAIVAEKTGYPQDMLDLDLDLEADLGIDTVKQAETFAAVRETFAIPMQEGLNLRDYPTLASVIGFVYAMRTDLAQDDTVASAQSAPGEAAETAAEKNAAGDDVAEKVLAIVAEKTGYPQDMLDLDLDLEADLGIDTVKQAETFAAVRETFAIPMHEGLNLRDYPTLASVIGFVYAMRSDLKQDESPQETPGTQEGLPLNGERAPSSPERAAPATIGTLADADRMPRRVPVPALRPPLDLCLPTGVTLGARSRVVVMPDRGGVGKALAARLKKLDVTVLTLPEAPGADELQETLQAWLAEGPIQGVYWLPALDVEPSLPELDLAQFRELNRVRVKNLYTTMRALYDAVAGPGKFLIAATRLGGLHGYGPVSAAAPLGGSVTGFTKAYRIEQRMREAGAPLVKAVDFEVSRKTAEPADLLLAETLADPGVVEAGYCDGLRYGVTLTEQPARDGEPGMTLDERTVFVITGAAGGITSAIVADLAVASRGTFYLLDLVDAPAADDPYVQSLRAGEDALKQKLIHEARAAGERPTPAAINRRIMEIERREAALRAVEAVTAAGGTAFYRSVDLLDGDAVSAVVDEVRQRHSRIDVLLHAGGLLIDRTLPEKEPPQFDLVFDVKADGFFNLLKAAGDMPIGATVVFSSVAGRFGNNGQSDYSAANDLLCKITSSMAVWRPKTRAVAIDWTAWGGIGMASRGSVPQIMEALGVDMLAPEAGVPTVRRELTYGATRGEVLVAGRLGLWEEELALQGGLDAEKAAQFVQKLDPPWLMAGKPVSANLFGSLEIETTLDPNEQPFLYDHAPDPGAPWLPGVMATEALAQAATLLAPGYSVVAVENEEMLAAFKFHRMEPRTLVVRAVITPQAGGDLVAQAVLRSVTEPAKPGLPTREAEHFRAAVRLRREAPEPRRIDFRAPGADSLPIPAAEIYKAFFHGPAYQVIERAAVNGRSAAALMARDLPPNTSPAHAASFMAPRLVELCFQTVALWSLKSTGSMALPAGIERVAVYRQAEEAGERRLYALVQARAQDGVFDAQVVDEDGRVYVELQGFRTVARPAL